MQVKFKRSYEDKKKILGPIERTYHLDVLLQASPEEDALLTKHYEWDKMLSLMGLFAPEDLEMREVVAGAMFKDLKQGRRFHAKSFGHLLELEGIIVQGCQRIQAHAENAETFEGQERVVEVEGDRVAVVA